MSRQTWVILVLAMALGVSIGVLVSQPNRATAKMTGGVVVGDWRCEHFGGMNEEDVVRWLDLYTPEGPEGLIFNSWGSDYGSFYILCVHEPTNQAEGEQEKAVLARAYADLSPNEVQHRMPPSASTAIVISLLELVS